MRNRFLTLSAVAALVPTLAIAQQRPAPQPTTPPANQPRPAAQPAQQPAARPAQPAPAQQPAARPATPPPAMAMHGPDRASSWEFTVTGALLSVDKALAGKTTGLASPSQFMYGGSASLAKHLSNSFDLGLGAAFGVGSNSASTIRPALTLTWSSDINSDMGFFVPISVGINRTKGSKTTATSDFGVSAGLGIRKFINEGTAFRIQGTMSYDHYAAANGFTSAYNGEGLVGLSFFPNAGPPRDTDGDGVPDKKDACPNTPRGAIVDARGCPRDSDHDGVYDGLDRCANTPANTPVDANGCPRDTDGDGIADNVDKCPNTPRGTPVYPATDTARAGCPVDTDGDGVADNVDRCPNTPRGVPVDANGCPRDSDGDGINDADDKCPNTPATARPVYPAGHAQAGCPVDTDGDGVADYLDRCPNTAAGTRVDPNGCPIEADTDHDGVPDSRDRCANTPPNTPVDATGCTLHALPANNQSLVLTNVRFLANTGVRATRLAPTSNTELDQVATAITTTLRTAAGAKFEVGAYFHNRGVAATIQRTTDQRAAAVVAYLTSHGVPASAVTAHGYGSNNPKAPNTTAAGRASNIRIELKRTS